MSSLKTRINIQNAIIILTIVIILESIFMFSIRNYYLEGASQELVNKASSSSVYYNKYLASQPIKERIRYIVENESKEDYVYTQVLNTKGQLLMDSNGFSSKETISSEDITAALDGEKKLINYKNEKDNDHILAISIPINDDSHKTLVVLRYISSIKNIDNTILKIFKISLSIIVIVILVTFLFSTILAGKIINPIKQLIIIAEKMAKGDFSQKSVKINNDEIGKLSDTLNYMSDEIMKSNMLKNEFISSISHELRTPLTAIKGWSEIMITGEIDNYEDAKEGIKIISSETDRLISLVEDLLDFSKLESGKIKLTLEKIDLNYTIKEMSKYFKNRISKENISLVLHIPQTPSFIMGDTNRLKQVFINVIDNAIKFSKPLCTIEISAFSKDDTAFIEIKDNGIGIAKKDLDKVMEKFYKGNSKYPGSGIGLAISKEIVSMHDGKLSLESEENVGTKVIIEIPII